MNPLNTQTRELDSYFMNFSQMYPKPYNKKKTSPYSKCRVILLNGLEFESNWLLHQLSRNCENDEIRREVAVIRKQEQQQQKRISCLKPLNESILETTIGYEQLAVDLTATLAQNDVNENNIKALNFALLEDFDHLYRFSNLLMLDKGEDATPLVGKFTEIMPARPTIAHHRYPKDDVKKPMCAKKSDIYSKLVAGIITAAEQQTMNYYMNIAQWYKNDLGRKLYAEIAMIEEEHVTQYESLEDPTCTWLEKLVLHEYTECYLYYSCMTEETDPNLKTIWAEHYEMECAHLKKSIELLKKFDNKSYESVIGEGTFPKLLTLGTNKEYVRQILLNTVNLTGDRSSYTDINKLSDKADFFNYQNLVIKNVEDVASHVVIQKAIETFGQDFRYQDKQNPIKDLNNRKKDNVKVGRCKC